MREDMNLQFPFAAKEPTPAATGATPASADTPAPLDAATTEEPASTATAAPADWKEALRRDFERWLETLDEMPRADDAVDAGAPDLFGFYEQLAALGAESRRANRRTAEAFSQWGETMSRFESELTRLRDELNRIEAGRADDRLPRGHCLMLIELLDRLQRVQAAFASPPAPGRWWERDDRWRKAWETQHQAFDIVVDHLESLLRREDVERIETLDQPFDPAEMVAVAAEPDAERPHQTVLEEIAPGYRRDAELLRPAHVKVSLNKETEIV
jgi:molecular chaperone GrpE (heat shock protein)